MVKQQEMKIYRLLSTHSLHFYDPVDPGFKNMWYIVSVGVP